MFCRALEPGDAALLAKTAKGWFPEGTAVLLGQFLALRALEIARVRWDGFDAEFEWCTLRGAKGGEMATLPVHSVLAEELRDRQTAWVWMFAGSRGRAHVTPTTIGIWVSDVAEPDGMRISGPSSSPWETIFHAAKLTEATSQ